MRRLSLLPFPEDPVEVAHAVEHPDNLDAALHRPVETARSVPTGNERRLACSSARGRPMPGDRARRAACSLKLATSRAAALRLSAATYSAISVMSDPCGRRELGAGHRLVGSAEPLFEAAEHLLGRDALAAVELVDADLYIAAKCLEFLLPLPIGTDQGADIIAGVAVCAVSTRLRANSLSASGSEMWRVVVLMGVAWAIRSKDTK